jgi:hypothetical protein
VIGVDQIIVGVGEERMSLVLRCPLRRRIGRGNELRRRRRGRAEGGVIKRRQIFSGGATPFALEFRRILVAKI